MGSLTETLREYHGQIMEFLYIGYACWSHLMTVIEDQEQRPSSACNNEQIWTFLLACGYAASREKGINMLTDALTGSSQKKPSDAKIWFEVLPLPPRKREGATHVDIALGTISRRQGTHSGIELADEAQSWVCFCEMKWHSDISMSVTHDPHRNQLARVIENALCFQSCRRCAETVFVTLVTPAIFRGTLSNAEPKLYQQKFEDYTADENRSCLVIDLEECVLEKRQGPGWVYPPDLTKRIERFSLRWETYDALFERMPNSDVAEKVKMFWERHVNHKQWSAPA